MVRNFTLIVGVGFNSFNIYALGAPLIMCLGGIIWVVVGYMWREYSIIITNLVLTMVSFDWNVNKYGDFFVKYVTFCLTYITDMILLSMILINNTTNKGEKHYV